MVDTAERMQCRHCLLVYKTKDFYDHIKDKGDGDADCKSQKGDATTSFRVSSANALRPHNRSISSIGGAH